MEKFCIWSLIQISVRFLRRRPIVDLSTHRRVMRDARCAPRICEILRGSAKRLLKGLRHRRAVQSCALLSRSPVILLDERVWTNYTVTIICFSCVRIKCHRHHRAYIVFEATDFLASCSIFCSHLSSIKSWGLIVSESIHRPSRRIKLFKIIYEEWYIGRCLTVSRLNCIPVLKLFSAMPVKACSKFGIGHSILPSSALRQLLKP